jgi:hypothetical protein
MWEGSMSVLSNVLHHKWVTLEDLRALVAALQWQLVTFSTGES